MAVVVAQLVKWLLLTQEIHSLNPVIGHSYLPSTVFSIKKKSPGMTQLEKKQNLIKLSSRRQTIPTYGRRLMFQRL